MTTSNQIRFATAAQVSVARDCNDLLDVLRSRGELTSYRAARIGFWMSGDTWSSRTRVLENAGVIEQTGGIENGCYVWRAT